MLSIDETVNQARARAKAASTAEIAGELRDALGEKMLGFVVGSAPSNVASWSEVEPPEAKKATALRRVYEVYLLLKPLDDEATIRAWLIGMNPMLDDRAPAELLAEGDFDAAFTAARAFAILG